MRTSFRQKLLLLGIGVALSLLASEGALRLLLPDGMNRDSGSPIWKWVIQDPILGWHNEPGFRHEDFGINSNGFRGPEIERERGPLRIVCIGDSRTFGIWMDQEHFRFDNDYPSRLQALIRTHTDDASAEVINAAVIGYSSSHGLRQYVTDVLALEPDVVVVGFGFNDHSPAYEPARRAEEPRNPIARRLHYALSHTQLYRLWEAARQSLGFLHPEPFSVPWVTPERYADNLRRFGEVSREHGIRLLLLGQGLRPVDENRPARGFPEDEKSPYGLFGAKDFAGLQRLDEQYLEILRVTAREEDIELLDIAEVFGRRTAPDVFGDSDFVHFDTAGADLMAAEVFERLRSLGWLDRSDARARD